jgi:copper homeostasis protein
MVTVEICVESVAGVRAAREGGAQRVELCCALGEGGLTPSAGALAAAVAVGGIEVVVLVRPRGGDFLYSAEEFALVERDVEHARELGAQGVAVGCLDAEGRVDAERLARLVARARPLAVCFHRAFDLVREPERELETLVALGVKRVLSAGGARTALVRAARGRLAVVAAGGVRPENAPALVRECGLAEVHLSAAARVESAMRFRNAAPRLGSARAPEEYAHWDTDAGRVRALVAALREL